jgi:hypothetical protein
MPETASPWADWSSRESTARIEGFTELTVSDRIGIAMIPYRRAHL